MPTQRKTCDDRIREAVEHAEYLKDIRIQSLESTIRLLQSTAHERDNRGHIVGHLNVMLDSFGMPSTAIDDEPILYRCIKRGCGWMPPIDRNWRDMEWKYQSQRDADKRPSVLRGEPSLWTRIRSLLPG